MIPPWTSVAVITVQGEGWFNRMLTSPNDCFGPTVVYQPARIWSCSPANHTLSLFFTEQKCIKHYHLWLTRNISSFIFLYVWHMLCIWKPQGRSEAFLSTVFFNDPESWRMLHSPRPNKGHKWTDLSLLHQHCKYRYKNLLKQETTKFPIKL